MYASMSSFSANGIDLSEAARLAGESMEEWMRGFDGYLGLLMLTGDDNARVISFWESREAVERSSRGRTTVRDAMAARIGVTLESVETYEVSHRADLDLG
ncbi:MAG TPA: hypothetical protein VH306_11745 [Gaiellaceae bacterium]|jgi:heme-degrading monooxygenase HmoA